MEEILLGLLRDGPAHGYELRARVRRELSPAWRFTSSQVYAWLGKLEQEGLVRGTVEELPGRPPRKVYALTPQGEGRFWTWVTNPRPRAQRRRGETLVRLFFLRRHAPSHLGSFIAREREELLRRRERLERTAPENDPFREAVRRFRLLQVDSGLRWLAELERMFKKEEPCGKLLQRW